VNFTTTVRTPDGTGSGWAGTSVNDWNELDIRALGATAVGEGRAVAGTRGRWSPVSWTVILEPTAVGNMVNLMVNAMGARSADEGRSFFSRPEGGNRIGEQVVDERVTIVSDPIDPRHLSAPFSGDGLPNRRHGLDRNGRGAESHLRPLLGERNDREPTGFASGWRMEGGSATIGRDDPQSTERGLLVTRFWYIRSVDPRTILFTGLTRDGTFLVENGRITHPVRNLRWNESPVFMLNNIEMMGEPVRVSSGESAGLTPAVIVPRSRCGTSRSRRSPTPSE
jgi:predicted Zn-dependent protease